MVRSCNQNNNHHKGFPLVRREWFDSTRSSVRPSSRPQSLPRPAEVFPGAITRIRARHQCCCLIVSMCPSPRCRHDLVLPTGRCPVPVGLKTACGARSRRSGVCGAVTGAVTQKERESDRVLSAGISGGGVRAVASKARKGRTLANVNPRPSKPQPVLRLPFEL